MQELNTLLIKNNPANRDKEIMAPVAELHRM